MQEDEAKADDPGGFTIPPGFLQLVAVRTNCQGAGFWRRIWNRITRKPFIVTIEFRRAGDPNCLITVSGEIPR